MHIICAYNKHETREAKFGQQKENNRINQKSENKMKFVSNQRSNENKRKKEGKRKQNHED